MEGRGKGCCFLKKKEEKKHMMMSVPALRSSKTARGSAARRLVQHKVRTSRWDSEQKHTQSREPLAEKLCCVRLFVPWRLFSICLPTL